MNRSETVFSHITLAICIQAGQLSSLRAGFAISVFGQAGIQIKAKDVMSRTLIFVMFFA